MYRTINDNYATHSVVNIAFYLSVLLSGKVNEKKVHVRMSIHWHNTYLLLVLLGPWRMGCTRKSQSLKCQCLLRLSGLGALLTAERSGSANRCARACVLETPNVAANAIARAAACARRCTVTAVAARDVEGELRCDGVAREGTNRCSRARSRTDPAMPFVGVRTTQLPP